MKKQIICIGSLLAACSVQALENKTIDYAVENNAIVVLTSYDTPVNEMFSVSLMKNGRTISNSIEPVKDGVGLFFINNDIPELQYTDNIKIHIKSTMQAYSHEVKLTKEALSQLGAEMNPTKAKATAYTEKTKDNTEDKTKGKYYSKNNLSSDVKNLGKLFSIYSQDENPANIEEFMSEIKLNDFSKFKYRDCRKLNDSINREYERASRRFKEKDFSFFESIKHISCSSKYDESIKENRNK